MFFGLLMFLSEDLLYLTTRKIMVFELAMVLQEHTIFDRTGEFARSL